MNEEIKITSKNVKEGMVICRNHFPYKPVKVSFVKDWGIRLEVTQPVTSGITVKPNEFDKMGYILLANDEKELKP